MSIGTIHETLVGRYLRVAAFLVLLPFGARATIVTTILDEDDGTLGGGSGISLREAMKYSATGATITFDAALSGNTIRCTGGPLLISRSITIDASALSNRITLSGDKTGDGQSADDTRVLQINSGTVVLDSLVISGGFMSSGAGIQIDAPSTSITVTIRNSLIVGNVATYVGGGIVNFGGILTLSKSTVSGNSAGAHGDGIHSEAGFNTPRGSLTINSSTFSSNSTGGRGGGIHCQSGDTLITNTTLSGNTAKATGGGISSTTSSLRIYHSTLSANSAGIRAGGIEAASWLLSNSIIAGNTSPINPDVSGSISLVNCIVSVSPRLAPLGNYGGSTQTMPPLPGSPANDAGDTSTLTTDQRSLPRVDTPDIGAAEYQGSSDLAQFWNLDPDGDGSPVGVEQALGTDNFTADAYNSRNLALQTFVPGDTAVLGFGLGPEAAPGTVWILRHSTDLRPESSEEIYRFDGISEISPPGIGINRSATGITIIDMHPSAGSGFYWLDVQLTP